jgi:uncharacterized protein YndB with AHSA1/START domain
MATLTESVVIGAPLADTWDLYFEPALWPSWVDGFGSVEASAGYPAVGGTLRWRSVPAGRGRVTEEVLEHEERRLHRIAFSDPDSEGELTTSFAIEPGGGEAATRVTQTLEYRLTRGGAFMWISDRLFIRGQIRASLRRSLARFAVEAQEGTAATPDR